MGNVIEKKTYFFLTNSVFEVASKNASNSASKFLLKCVMIKLLHREKINPHIVFFPADEVENIKTDFGNKFQSLMQIGENMFCAENNPAIKGKINYRILSYATDMDGDIPNTDKVKIVYADNLTKMFFDKEINEDNYPVGIFSVEEALEKMEEINKQFEDGNYYERSEKQS